MKFNVVSECKLNVYYLIKSLVTNPSNTNLSLSSIHNKYSKTSFSYIGAQIQVDI